MRDFHIGDILTITTGALVSPRHMEGPYDILGYMVGFELFTHQLPVASKYCIDNLRQQFPDLAKVEFPGVPEGQDAREFVDEWLNNQVSMFGEVRSVSTMTSEQQMDFGPYLLENSLLLRA